jgi:PIN domain nuclease of toxin-antitoxin system
MRLLLDTSALLSWVHDEKRLGAKAYAAMADSANAVFVSAASAWEISIKRATGKLEAPGEVRDWIAAASFDELPITVEHASAAGALPLHHRDPFDRMLVAQAQLESLTLVAHDDGLARYDVAILDARV